MADSLYYPVAEFSLAALATLAYSFYKFPRSWKVGVSFVLASLFFALVSALSSWIFYHSHYSSILLAEAAFYGMLFGAAIFGIAAVLEGIFRGYFVAFSRKR